MKNIGKPPCPTVSGWNPFKQRSLKSTPIYIIYSHFNTYKCGLKCPIFLGWQRCSSRNLYIVKYSILCFYEFQVPSIQDIIRLCRFSLNSSLRLPWDTCEIRDIRPCKVTQEIDPFKWWCHSTWLGTSTPERSFAPWNVTRYRKKNNVAPNPPAEPEQEHRPNHRAGGSTGARPGHRVSSGTCPGFPQGRCCHPGSFPWGLPPRHCQRCPPAPTGQLGFAVLRRCAWKLKEIQETDRIIRRKTDKKSETKIARWRLIDNCMPHGIRTRPIIQFQLWEGRSAHLLCLFQFGHGFSIGLSLIRPNDIVQPSNDQWSTFWTLDFIHIYIYI